MGRKRSENSARARKERGACPRCGTEDPGEFDTILVTGRRCIYCSRCNAYNAEKQRDWVARNPQAAYERSLESSKQYRVNHPERASKSTKLWNDKRYDKMTEEERKAYFRRQYNLKKARMIEEGTWEEYIKKRAAQDARRVRSPAEKKKRLKNQNEYMKRRLVRLKKDPVAYEEYLRKRREADKKRRAKLKKDPVAYEAQQKKRRASEKRSRERKRAADE